VKKTKLLDLFGLSGDPADNDRLDDLFLRLEADTSAVSEEISIFVEEAHCGCELFSTPDWGHQSARLKLAARSTN
jgi:hypothetical protein